MPQIPPLTPPPPSPLSRSMTRDQWKLSIAGALFGGVLALPLIPLAARLEARHLGIALIAWIVSIAIHEGGHAVAATRLGYRLLVFYVGPLRFARAGRGFRLRFSILYAFRGATIAVPATWEGETTFRRKMLRYIAAGSMVNFAATLLAFAPGTSWKVFAFVSFVFGAVSWTPFRGQSTDGTQLLRLVRHSEADARRLYVSALAMLTYSIPPAEWPPELVANLDAAAADKDVAFIAGNLAYHKALHDGDAATAGSMLQRSIDAANTAPHRALVAIDGALFEAAWRGDAAAGRQWLARGKLMAREDRHGALLA